MDNLPKTLQEQLRKHKVIPFVGAGVSMVVRDKETDDILFPSWKTLLECAVARLQQETRPDHAKAVQGLIGIGPGEYLAAAKRARQGLTGDLWFRFLRDQLDISRDSVADDSLDLARAIWELGSSLIITTNYDRVLPWACPKSDDLKLWDIEAPAEQVEALRGDGTQRPTVWHLHGSIDNATRMILTPDGYSRLYPEAGSGETQYKAALSTLRHFMTSHTLLFVGFSLEDDYLGLQLQGLNEIFQGATGPHYVLVREAQVQQTDRLIKERELSVNIVTFRDFGEPMLKLVQSMGQIAAEGAGFEGTYDPVPKVGDPPPVTPNYAPSNYLFYIPYRQKGDQVIGREHALEEVHTQLTSGHGRTSIGQAVAFQGLGGLGKTQIAVEYAYRYKKEYPNGVIWINADQDIEAQLAELSDRAGWVASDSEHRYKLDVARHRLKTYSDCLIIFDNLEDISAIEGYLPEPQADPHILVTSRTEQPGFSPFHLDLLDDDLSLELLTQEAGRKPEGDSEEEAARKIVEALGGLPLALELAGGYLRHLQSVSWQQYYELLDQNLKSAMLGRFLAGSFTKHEADIYSTLKLNEEFFADEPQLKEVVDLLVWSGPASMGLSLMCGLLGIEGEITLTNALALGVELRLLQKTPSEERYAIHRLVREVRREDTPLEGREEWINSICQRTGEWFQQRRENFADLPVFEAEIDHLRAWQEHAMRYAHEDAIRLTWLQAYPPYHQGRYREAKALVEKALELSAKSDLPDRELEAHLLNDQGSTYHALGDHKLALEYLDKALEIRRELFGEKHPDTARSLNNVGSTYGQLGDHSRALEYHEQALEIQRELLGEKDPDIAASLNNVGTTYGNLGDHKRALEYKEKALGIQRELFGEKHPDIAASLNNVGTTYGNLSDHKRALEHKEKALEIWRELFGEKHPSTALSLNNVGTTYHVLGDHKSGLEYKEKALKIRRELLGEKHPDTVDTVLDLAVSYINLGNGSKAVNLLDEFLRIIPREHPSYNHLRQRRQEVLAHLTGGGFRKQPRKNRRPKKEKKRR